MKFELSIVFIITLFMAAVVSSCLVMSSKAHAEDSKHTTTTTTIENNISGLSQVMQTAKGVQTCTVVKVTSRGHQVIVCTLN